MESIQKLADEIFREKVLRARAADPAEKIFAGARLFDSVCRIMEAGIRHQHPEASDAEVKRILFERVAIARRLEETA